MPEFVIAVLYTEKDGVYTLSHGSKTTVIDRKIFEQFELVCSLLDIELVDLNSDD